MSWLRRLFRREAAPATLPNEGLALAMDSGDQWLAPTNARLHRRHPHLRADELAALDAACRGAMRLGHETVHGHLRSGVKDIAPEPFASVVRARYPWVDDENLTRLLRQSLYYAARTGVYERDA